MYLAEFSVTPFLNTIKNALLDFSTDTLASILIVTLGVTVGLAIAWFGYRFIVRKVQKALRKGSL